MLYLCSVIIIEFFTQHIYEKFVLMPGCDICHHSTSIIDTMIFIYNALIQHKKLTVHVRMFFYKEYHMFLIIIIHYTPLIMGTKDLKDFVSL